MRHILLLAALALAACHPPPQGAAPVTAETVVKKIGAAVDLASCAASTAAAVPELVNVFSSGDVPGGIAALLAANPLEKIMCAVSAIATMSSQAGPVVNDTGAGRDPWTVLHARADTCRAARAREAFCKPPDEAALYLVERARIARDISIPPPRPAPPAPAPAAPAPLPPPPSGAAP